ncbi:hypothetical protein CPB83DRAFT_895515 [Crepidotus variabilis]|uniref:Uncharacterized protein n=1 Tax=Crepidotus variabilis TaxID=179855 RepID=A0A9P6EDT2_9AGAR|nr:hypothetical protein CPB83DRAFT_895515 [Crepidotus variabilis]
MEPKEEPDVSLIRTRSPVITTFPWQSGAVGARPDIRSFANSESRFFGFLSHLRTFERTCLLSPTSTPGKYFRHLLQLEFTLDELQTLRAKQGQKRSPQDWAVLASVVCAYRLADVIALFETEQNIPPVSVPCRPKEGPSLPLQWLYRLDDWTTLLNRFKKTYTREKRSQHLSVHPGNIHIGLMKSVVQCSTVGDLNNISANIFAAALHLEYLMKHSFADDELPELTENFQELTNICLGAHEAPSAANPATLLSEQEVAFWTETFGNSTLSTGRRAPSSGKERQPLHLALSISPLYLLIPNQIMSKQIGRENIISTSMALGNQRPSALLAAEKTLWQVLFCLAEGKLNPGHALQTIYDGIDWTALKNCSSGDRLWFKLPRNETSKPNKPTTSPGLQLTSSQSKFSPNAFAKKVLLSRPTTPPNNDHMDVDSAQTSGGKDRSAPVDVADKRPASSSIDQDDEEDLSHAVEIEALLAQDFQHDTDPPPARVTPPLHSSPQQTLLMNRLEVTNNDANSHFEQNMHDLNSRLDGCSTMEVGDEEEDEVMKDDELQHESDGSMTNEMDVDKIDNDTEDQESNSDTKHIGPAPSREERENTLAQKEDYPPPMRRSVRLLVPSGATPATATIPRTRGQAAATALADQTAASIANNSRPSMSKTRRRSKRKTSPVAETATPAGLKDSKKRKAVPDGDHDVVNKPLKKKSASLRSNSLIPIGGETRDNPIDVDGYSLFVAKRAQLYEVVTPTLSPLLETPAKRYTLSQPLRVWDAHNVQHEIHPRLHSPEELVKIGLIMQSVAKSDVNHQARHVAAEDSSIFYKIDYKSYKDLTHAEAERILKRQCLVVYDMEWDDIDFDEEGLSTLGALDAVVSIQGILLLALVISFDDLSKRVVQGTTQQMLESSRAGGAAKALNGLSFPFDTAELEKTAYAACRVAWKSTSRTVFQSSSRMPVSDVHWGLAATEGAMTFWHIDSDGLATTVDIRTGEKLWIAATGDQEQYSKLGLLLSNDFDIDRPPKNFDTEAILLTKNTRLIMRPNVIHAAYTPKHTICHGSHFYSTGAMHSTLVSLIHGFICHSFITNISHPETRILLRRIVHFYHRGLVEGAYMTASEQAHLPQIDVAEGSLAPMDEVVNFLSACAIVFFSNALDPRTYTPPGMDSEEGHVASEGQKTIMDTYDVNAISPEEREEICEARGATLEALAWFRCSFEVRREADQQAVDFVAHYFTWLARSILRYKHVAELNGVKSAADFTTKELEAQVENLLKMDAESWALWTASH